MTDSSVLVSMMLKENCLLCGFCFAAPPENERKKEEKLKKNLTQTKQGAHVAALLPWGGGRFGRGSRVAGQDGPGGSDRPGPIWLLSSSIHWGLGGQSTFSAQSVPTGQRWYLYYFQTKPNFSS